MSLSSNKELASLVTGITLIADKCITAWHMDAPVEPAETPENTADLIAGNLYFNYQLWHVEDEARRTDVPDAAIATIKRTIDRLNQLRNNAIEAIDTSIAPIILSHPGYRDDRRHNSETAGSIIDRLHILSLKLFHMNEQAVRTDASEKHRIQAGKKCRALDHQRALLATALMELIDDYHCGNRSLHRFRQFKMYNDPSLNPALYAAGTT